MAFANESNSLNNFAITSAGIGEAMQRSASALYAGGNTIDESIALITAANSVIQDPMQVGTALKTLTLRLRGAKVELEEAGLDAEDMVETTAQLQEKLKALTHGKVDIMIDEDTFKNTTQILREMSYAWQDMTDMEILESCRLIKKNEAGEIEGFKYAALLLFGSDDAIAEHLPRYKFELLYHKMTYERFNMNLPEDSARYDDRKTVRSNIIQAYRQMLDFVVKYLPDKFYLPDNGSTARLDLRVQIFREIIGNICAHSDYQPGFGGYVEVFYDRVITKNATRLIPTMKEGSLTLDELGPYTKNPLIVKVLNELHFVEDLGSGRRNLKRYAPLYYPDYKIEISNGNQFEFSITYDDLSRGKANETANNTENQHNKEMLSQNETPNEIAVDTARASSKANINAVYNAIKANTDISVDDICRICKISRATAARAIAWLKENKYIDRTTANQYGSWIILK